MVGSTARIRVSSVMLRFWSRGTLKSTRIKTAFSLIFTSSMYFTGNSCERRLAKGGVHHRGLEATLDPGTAAPWIAALTDIVPSCRRPPRPSLGGPGCHLNVNQSGFARQYLCPAGRDFPEGA